VTALAVGTIALCVGLVAGKWLEALRWRRNAGEVWRLASRGRLYKVEDVTPW
jgi:hypothetical protein